MANAPLEARLTSSMAVLWIAWFVSGVAMGFYVKDVRALFLCFLWSLPFFAVAWVIVGIPLIAMGDRILRTPTILLGIAGAVCGALIMLLPFAIVGVIANGTVNLAWHSAYFKTGKPLLDLQTEQEAQSFTGGYFKRAIAAGK